MKLMVVASAMAWFCAIGIAQEVAVFDNFGPNNTYANFGTWMGSGFGEVMYSASAFTPTASGKITRFEAGMTLIPEAPNEVTLHVLTGIGSVPPTSTSIWSQTFQDSLALYQGISAFALDDGPIVQAGTRYWLYVETPITGVHGPQYRWATGLIGTNPVALYFASSPTRPNTWMTFDPPSGPGRSLRVTAVVPEPLTILPAGTALLLLIRRRQCAEIENTLRSR